MSPLDIIIIEKTGIVKSLSIKQFNIEELYKKCGFKKSSDFIKHVEWSVKHEEQKLFIEVYAKTDGRANSENKYDFPPPIDNKLFFGSCAVLAYCKTPDKKKIYINLSLPMWNKIYENLFGGFEDLSSTALADELEEDELDKVPSKYKTKQGYLKDGFVVDDDNSDIDEDSSVNEKEEINELDTGSELSEDTYIA
jgi:hypothetical protein